MKGYLRVLVAAIVASGALLASCKTAGLTPGGAKVALVRDKLPDDCVQVGYLVGEGGGTFGGAYISNEDLINYAMNDLRNKAAQIGATHVRTDPPQIGSGKGTATTVTITGTGYKCK